MKQSFWLGPKAKKISEHASIEPPPPLPKSRSQVFRDASNFRVEASFGEEKIRVSLQPNWVLKIYSKKFSGVTI